MACFALELFLHLSSRLLFATFFVLHNHPPHPFAFPQVFFLGFIFKKLFHVCRCSFAMSLFCKVFLCKFFYACNSQLNLASSHNIMWFSCFYVCSFSFLFLQCLLLMKHLGRNYLVKALQEKIFLKFWKRYCLHLLFYLVISLICILLISILLHLLLHHHWLLMILMNCCGSLMEMTFMYRALNFMNIVTFSIDKHHVDFIWLHHDIDKPPLHSIVLHLEEIGDYCGHFFNPYINLHLEDFDFFLNVSNMHLLIFVVRFLFLYPFLCLLLYLIQIFIQFWCCYFNISFYLG